jgi:hypothetical protein
MLYLNGYYRNFTSTVSDMHAGDYINHWNTVPNAH